MCIIIFLIFGIGVLAVSMAKCAEVSKIDDSFCLGSFLVDRKEIRQNGVFVVTTNHEDFITNQSTYDAIQAGKIYKFHCSSKAQHVLVYVSPENDFGVLNKILTDRGMDVCKYLQKN